MRERRNPGSGLAYYIDRPFPLSVERARMSHLRKTAVATLVLAPLVAGGFIVQDRASRDGARLFDQVVSLVAERFVDTVATGDLYEKAARGLLHELNDPYTELYTPKQLEGFTTRTAGHYGGVGMSIEEQQNGDGSTSIMVAKVFPNTPAEGGGVQEGDRIVKVDTASTKGWKLTQVSGALTGTPGTKVNVEFARPGVPEPIKARFTRAVIRIPAVPYAIMLDGGIGYVPLQSFNETATDEVESAVQRLVKEGAKGLILDVRENPGGILEQSLSISNLFLQPGQEILSVRGRTQQDQQTYIARRRPIAGDVPLVVLTNGYSASAAEIVAGALQDHDRALIVGTTSFGKGLVQTLYPLDGGYAIKMTTAKWYTPSGRSIQKERKVVDGRFVNDDDAPDSLETDTVKKSRPTYKSDAGRTVYGGGGITPDVILKPDTLSSTEQAFVKAIASKSPTVRAVLQDYALELKPRVSGNPNFKPEAAWRDEFYRRLTAKDVKVDRKLFDSASTYVDRALESFVARFAFGDSTAKRHDLPDDVQLKKALELLRKGQSQKDLFALAGVSVTKR